MQSDSRGSFHLRSLCAGLAMMIVSGFALPAIAADLYVSPKGNDANPGTAEAQPLRTLQKANDVAKPGDTIWVMEGIYRNEKSDAGGGGSSLLDVTTSGTADAWITYRAYKDQKPELIAQGCWNAINLRASYIVIDGLTLTGNNDNVYLTDAEANAENDVDKTRAKWIAEGSMDAEFDLSATPNKDGAPGAKPAAPAAPATPAAQSTPAAPAAPRRVAKSRPVTYQSPSPLYNGNGINADFRGDKPKHHHFVIRNCTIRKFGTVGISMMATDYYTLENNNVYDNAWYSRYGGSGISQLGGVAFDNKPGYHNFILNNRVWNNKSLVRVYYLDLISDGNGIILDSLVNYPGGILVANNGSFGNGGAGIHVFKSSKAKIDIVNNTCWRNQQTWQLYDLGAHAATNVNFLNNIVVAEKYKTAVGKPETGIRYDYNIYFGGSSRLQPIGPNDLVADPMFARATHNFRDADFRVRPGSPALNSGTTELALPTDRVGQSRPTDAAPSRGAYQNPFAPSSTNPGGGN